MPAAPMPMQRLTLEHVLTAYNQNQFAEAIRLTHILRASHAGPELAYIEVMALLGLEEWQKAADTLTQEQARLRASPLGQAMSDHALGRLYLRQNQWNESLPPLARATQALTDNQACFIDYAQSLFVLNRFPEAQIAFLRALAIGPCTDTLFKNIGVCAMQQKRHVEAIAYLSAAWTMEPTDELAVWLAGCYYELKKYAKARNYFRQALRIKGPNVDILNGLGKCYEQQKNYRRALNFFKEALALAQTPTAQAAVHRNIAISYERLYQLETAQKHCRQAIRLDPHMPAHYFHLIHTYQIANQFEQGLKAVNDVEKLIPGHPDVTYARGFLQLLEGDWANGWKNFEARWQASHLRERYARTPSGLASTFWDGKADLQGKLVMAFCEQGAGDYFNFARYCRHLSELGATVDLLIPPHLAEVAKTLPWIRDVHTRFEQIPPHDYHVSLMTMPLYMGTLPETVPAAETPYLSAPTNRERYSDRLTVGVTWYGDPNNPYEFLRAIPDRQLRVLLEGAPEVQFVAIQAGPMTEVAQGYIEEGLWINGLPESHDFSDVAAAINACDLLVSVCTANAHLAGAMHKPVWLLLAEYSEWRWQKGALVQAWYPTMRHIRQAKAGEWHEELASVALRLRKKAKNFRPAKQKEIS